MKAVAALGLVLLAATGCAEHPAAAAACGVRDRAQQPGASAAPEYVGLSLDAAEQSARRTGSVLVVLGSDGDCPYDMPGDLRGDRVTVYLEGGRVTAAAVG